MKLSSLRVSSSQRSCKDVADDEQREQRLKSSLRANISKVIDQRIKTELNLHDFSKLQELKWVGDLKKVSKPIFIPESIKNYSDEEIVRRGEQLET